MTATVVEKILRPVILGRDPMQGGVLQHEMYDAMDVRGHFTGFMLDAISGVDSATIYHPKGVSCAYGRMQGTGLLLAAELEEA